jgi:quercetin dioxygenase-like cupin family protein
MDHPTVIDPLAHAVSRPDKMGKATLFSSERLLVGLNTFEPGQQHPLHTHDDMDKLYVALEGEGELLLEGRALPLREGQVVIAPRGVPHGVRNTGALRLVVLAALAPAPSSR